MRAVSLQQQQVGRAFGDRVRVSDWAWLALAGVLAVVAMRWMTAFPVWDAALWEYAGNTIAHGGALYRDVWDNKLPGIYYLNALFELLLPGRYLVHEAIAVAINLMSIACFAALLRAERVRGWAPAAAAFAAVLCLPAPQLDMPEYVALALILSAYLLWRGGRPATAGIALALATSFWLQSALAVVPLLLRAQPAFGRRNLLLGFAGAAVALAAAFVAAFGPGRLGELASAWSAYVAHGGGEGTPLGQIPHNVLTGLDASVAGPLLLVAAAFAARPRSELERFVAVWAACMLVAVLPLVQYFDHYFIPLKAPLVAAIWTFAPRVRLSLPRAVVALAALVLFAKSAHFVAVRKATYANEADVSRRAGAAIATHLGANAVLRFEGYEPGVALAAGAALSDRFTLAAAPNQRWLAARAAESSRPANVIVTIGQPAADAAGYDRVCARTAAPFRLYAAHADAQRFRNCS
jgi:hypothetical protein